MKNYIKLIGKENNKKIAFFIILNISLVIADTIAIGLIPLFIDLFVNSDPILFNYFSFLKDSFQIGDKHSIFKFSIIFFLIIFLIKNIFYLSVVYYQAKFRMELNVFLRKKFLNLYLFAPFEITKSYNSSEILRNTVTETKNYITNFFNILRFSKDILLFFSIFFLLLLVDFYSTLIVLLFLVILVTLYISIFYRYLNTIGKKKLSALNQVYQWINQTCGAIKEIKITKKEIKVLDRFSDKVKKHEQTNKMTEIISSLPTAIFEISFVIIMLFLIKFITDVDSKETLPSLSLYVIAFIRMLPIISRFGSTISVLRTFNPSVLLLNDEINKLEKYSRFLNNFSNIKKEDELKFKRKLQLENIFFKYTNGKKNIFENFNFQIEKGKSIAFLGKSGSGKTTLINIICGLLKPTSGEILVDGRSVNNKVTLWQKNIGLISQDNYLLDDTLENNIVFLNNRDTINKQKLEDSIFYSGVSDFLGELKYGLNTKIGEKGSILSSGQIQRVALARLLYRDPEVLILDEFTNSLDPNNEDFILQKLEQLKNKKNKTYIVISHKLKPLKICDEIIILENGNISEKFNYSDFYNKYHLLYD